MPRGRKPLKPELVQTIARAIKKDILLARIPPGCVLTEANLIARFSKPRHAVRRALVSLEKEGLVDIKPSGTIVAGVSQAELEPYFISRMRLEPIMARLFALKADKDLAALESTLHHMRKIVENGFSDDNIIDFIETDLKFHTEIIVQLGSGFELIADFLQKVYKRLRMFTSHSVQARATAVIAEHGSILNAIKGNDANAAGLRMEEHLGTALRGWHECKANRLFAEGRQGDLSSYDNFSKVTAGFNTTGGGSSKLDSSSK